MKFKLGLFGMVSSFCVIVLAIYVLFVSNLQISLPWTIFWHFTLMITSVMFKLSYVVILACSKDGVYR
ncbi:hypothetical protein KO505_00130 [Psychrosphaera sp. F3M07]|uniref:hypothetical protein n=1 Tax=Psychrosphaera sp. F3M07 TaxID=2841560 RepID=UPI001C091F9B|nr:hypothetical protein [Psychrosphaera sp. F3M07]MBU2916362.1 hypothetical protein [Psychrosphaera sp. F3M07]